MTAVLAIDGRVARAIEMVNRTDLWVALARPYAWSVARLTGTVAGPFTVASTHDFIFSINGFEVTYSVPSGASQAAVDIANGINAAAALVDASLASVASVVTNFIRITAPTPGVGTASISVDQGSDDLGFLTGKTYTVPDDLAENPIPPPDPSQRELFEPFVYAKINTSSLVVPDADTSAVVTGTVQGNTFDTSIASDANTLTFTVDGSAPIVVTFPDSMSTPLASVLSTINTAAQAIDGSFSNVARVDGTVSPPRVKIVSPTSGSTSTVEVTSPSPASGSEGLGIAVQSVSGTDGGAIEFRSNQYATVLEADAYDEGARWVYLSAEFAYDEAPVESYSQIGLVGALVPAGGFGAATLLEPDNVDDPGILEVIDHIDLTNRNANHKETVQIVVEF